MTIDTENPGGDVAGFILDSIETLERRVEALKEELPLTKTHGTRRPRREITDISRQRIGQLDRLESDLNILRGRVSNTIGIIRAADNSIIGFQIADKED